MIVSDGKLFVIMGFDDLDDGDLPEGISGEVIAEAIAKPQEIFQIYEHIQKNKSNR